MTAMKVEPKLIYLLCKPDLAFSTPKLFAKLDEALVTRRPNHEAMTVALKRGDAEAVGKHLCNIFEEAVLPEYEEIRLIKNILLDSGATGAQMTGSGSVVFGVFLTEEQALSGENALKNRFPNTFYCKTV